MNVSKIALSTNHRIWCENFMKEEAQSVRMVRKLLKRSAMYNPFSTNKEINKILKRYERSFWG